MDGDTYNYKGAACGDWEFPDNPCPKGLSPIGGKSNASNFTLWLTHYHNTVVNSKVARDKAAIAMMATTEAGVWNCRQETMRQRVAQMLADGVPELAIFELFPDPKGKCGSNVNASTQCTCSDPWLPVAAEFLAGELSPATRAPAAAPGAAIKTDDAGKSSFGAVRGSAGFIGTVSARYTKITYRNESEKGLGFTIRF